MKRSTIALICVGFFARSTFAQTAPTQSETSPVVVLPNKAVPAPEKIAVLTTGTLQVQEPLQFGQKHQWLLGGSTSAAFSGIHQQLDGLSRDEFAMNVEPRIGYFVAKNIAVGLLGNISYRNVSKVQAVGLGVGPFAGYSVPVHPHLSFFPMLSLQYAYSNGMVPDASVFSHLLNLQINLAMVLHVAEHISLSVSPYVSQSLYNRTGTQYGSDIAKEKGPWNTIYGIQCGVLGWL